MSKIDGNLSISGNFAVNKAAVFDDRLVLTSLQDLCAETDVFNGFAYEGLTVTIPSQGVYYLSDLETYNGKYYGSTASDTVFPTVITDEAVSEFGWKKLQGSDVSLTLGSTTYTDIDSYLTAINDTVDSFIAGTSGVLSVNGEEGVVVLTASDIDIDTITGYTSTNVQDVVEEVIGKLTSVLTYKGSVTTYTALPSSGNNTGDVYNVSDTGKNYAWSGTDWDDLGGIVDLSAYSTTTQIASTYATISTTDSISSSVATNTTNIATNTSAISSLETTVASKADSTTVNTLSGTVATNTTNIATNTNDIALINTALESVASASDLDDLEAEVSSIDTTLTALETTVAGKVDTTTYSAKITTIESSIGDLDTELDSTTSSLTTLLSDLADVATSGDYDDLTNKPTIPSLDGYATTSYVDTQDATKVSVTVYEAKVIELESSIATKVDTTTYNAKVSSLETSIASKQNIMSGGTNITITDGNTINVSNLADVATSGDYDDLTNKPTIPSLDGYATTSYVTSALDELTKSDVGLSNVDNTSDADKPVSTATQTALDLKADKTYVDTEISSAITSVYRFKGTVDDFASLPTTSLTIGDVYNTSDTGMNYAWTGTAWDTLGLDVDLSLYSTTTEITAMLSGYATTSTVSSLATTVSTNSTNITSLQTTTSGHTTSITDLTSDVTQLESDVADKAELDASNLTTANVTSWKSKLGIPCSFNDIVNNPMSVDGSTLTVTSTTLKYSNETVNYVTGTASGVTVTTDASYFKLYDITSNIEYIIGADGTIFKDCLGTEENSIATIAYANDVYVITFDSAVTNYKFKVITY